MNKIGFEHIKVGDKVVIETRHGIPIMGRAAYQKGDGGWVLACKGLEYRVAYPANIVSINRKRAK